MIIAASGLSSQADWRTALAEALEQMPALRGEELVDVCFLFASHTYAADFGRLAIEASIATRARAFIGCSGQGVIGTGREIEDEPALALMALRLPGATFQPVRITQADLVQCESPEDWRTFTGVPPAQANAWILFADPFTLDAERLVAALAEAYPETPLVGGMASGDFAQRRTHVFLNRQVYEHGAVALALGGAYTVRAVVSQGCTPIGQPWIITGAQEHFVTTIAQRPAYDVLVETLRRLPEDLQERARGNLLVGLAIDERRKELHRGDFLIRNLLGVDRATGALAVGALPRVGQTVQFQIRDREAAHEDLIEMLTVARATLPDDRPVAALLCSCNGRGVGLFGTPDHDARVLAEKLGPVPTAGFFCNGEIGPVGPRAFLHGFTASIALITPHGAGVFA